MSDKVKVYNNNRFDVGIRFENDRGREVNIKGTKENAKTISFGFFSEDDILYINSVSKLFEEGVLYVENAESNEKMGFTEKNPNIISDDKIKGILTLSLAKMKAELANITSEHAIDKIVNIAKDSDLQPSKLKVLEEMFGKEIIEDIGKNVV